MRYIVKEGSSSLHDCCFSASVMDTSSPDLTICECADVLDAKVIASILNFPWNPRFAIGGLVKLCHGDAVKAGWYTDIHTGEPKNLNVGERMALIHSEISEAFEAYRKNLMDDHLPDRKGIEVEMADAVIRICDLAGAENLDLAGAIMDKLDYNRSRADHKIENRLLENGKKC
jgi:NTP pyrophosphatase (non-canonical NTP hydrolase)